MAAVDCQVTFLYSPGTSPERVIQRSKRRGHRLNMMDDITEESINGLRAPIIGYEIVERREKFTVYKIQVHSGRQGWFVFRRYTDFVRLNDKLRTVFSGFHFKLPAKRWFLDNFDPDFVEERAQGLQLFVNNIMHHSNISRSSIVKQFFCIDDPPGPYDSLEESRAYCQSLEGEVDDLKEKVDELAAELSATKSQLAQARVQQEALVSSLKAERASSSRHLMHDSPVYVEAAMERRSSNGNGLRQEHTDRGRMELHVARTASEETKSHWIGKLEIAAHSKGVEKIKPVRKHSGPLTSTPVKDVANYPALKSEETSSGETISLSDANDVDIINGFTGETTKSSSLETAASYLDKHTNELVINEETVKPTLLQNDNKAECEIPTEQQEKRDSGIVIDHSPTTNR